MGICPDTAATSLQPMLSVVITADLTLDHDSQVWLDRLDPNGPAYTTALEDLYGLLLKAARFEIGRRQAPSPSCPTARRTLPARPPPVL